MGTAAEKARIRGQDLFSRITSISILGFGIGLKFPHSERSVVRDVIISLEDRRVLYVSFNLEVESQVVDSVRDMRKELVAALKLVGAKSPAAAAFNVMRTECRRFLTEPRSSFENIGDRGPHGRGNLDAGFFESLGKLRAIFGQQLAELAVRYDLDLSPDLLTILPPPLDTDDGDDDLERQYWRY